MPGKEGAASFKNINAAPRTGDEATGTAAPVLSKIDSETSSAFSPDKKSEGKADKNKRADFSSAPKRQTEEKPSEAESEPSDRASER